MLWLCASELFCKLKADGFFLEVAEGAGWPDLLFLPEKKTLLKLLTLTVLLEKKLIYSKYMS